MTSKITIEVDFDNGTPYIRVINDKKSDDVRDKLITDFRRKLGYSSSWCKVRFDDTGDSGNVLFEIHPIRPSELEAESKEMTDRVQKSIQNPTTL